MLHLTIAGAHPPQHGMIPIRFNTNRYQNTSLAIIRELFGRGFFIKICNVFVKMDCAMELFGRR